MRYSKSLYFALLSSLFFLALIISCAKPPAIPDFLNVGGYVIAKEICNSEEAKDYWLIDLTYRQNTPQYGDTLLLNGTVYTNVIKTKDLYDTLKQIGMKVTIDFKILSPTKVITSSCSVPNPKTYNLKELFIINQGVIR